VALSFRATRTIPIAHRSPTAQRQRRRHIQPTDLKPLRHGPRFTQPTPKDCPQPDREDLAEFRRHLSLLSTDGIEGIYQTAYTDCRLDRSRFPPAAAIQQLVAAWKVLRKIRAKKVRDLLSGSPTIRA